LKTAYIGEVGLSGEGRPVARIEERLNELQKMGFERAIVSSNQKVLNPSKFDLEILFIESVKNIGNFL